MLIVRSKTDPLAILRWGYVVVTVGNPYPLGAFDAALFEQVEASGLPDGFYLLPVGGGDE